MHEVFFSIALRQFVSNFSRTVHTKESIHIYLLNVCVEGRVLARNYSKIPQSSAGGQGNVFMIFYCQVQ